MGTYPPNGSSWSWRMDDGWAGGRAQWWLVWLADGSTPSCQVGCPSFYWPAVEHLVIINEPVTRSVFAFSCARGGMGMSWPSAL